MSKSTVSRADLKKVNRYIEERGAGTIQRWDAEYFGEHVWENSETYEIKTTWELVVDFVDNAESEEPQDLGYVIVFDRAGFGIEENEVWERIGR